MKFKNFLLTLAIISNGYVFAQEGYAPTSITEGIFVGKTIPLRDFTEEPGAIYNSLNELTIVQNGPRQHENVNANALPLDGDPLAQTEVGGIASFPISQNFIGGSISESGGFIPPDPTGAVGPNHYVHAFNSRVKIFSKTGTLLVGPVSLGAFLGISTNLGDPIVMYDQLADRYFVSQFGGTSNQNLLTIGVSDTNDPTGAYNVYTFSFDGFPDYPHYSVWPDGYYLTINKLGGNSEVVYAIERDVVLAGGPSPQMAAFPLPGITENPVTIDSPEPANLTGTVYPADVPGYMVYLQDDSWPNITFDHLKIWEIEMDWDVIANSTISDALELPTDPFDSAFAPFGAGDVGQPGTSQKIDMMGGIISYAANYRSFPTYNTLLITFNVDVDGNDTAGVRWIELRNDSNNDWSIYQEGTYAPADGHSRFMGSMAMDAEGNIGMGFNIASSTLAAGIRYTGRFDGDPLGQMTVAETTIFQGPGVQTFSNRFGDYTHLTMDPDNFTFWFTAQYFSSTNQWRTRIAAFRIFGPFSDDVGVNNITSPSNGLLTNTETVEVSIRNYSPDPITNVPLELRVDGNLVASETYIGTINSNEIVPYQFTQTVDLSTSGQTYSLEAKTVLAGDGYTPNDSFTKEITHLLANDVGVVSLITPTTGSDLGDETVLIKVKNFGATTQSGFDVEYTVDAGTPVVQSFTGPINSEEEVNFSFTQTADLSVVGTYNFTSKTSLSSDQLPANDEISAVVENLICLPFSNCEVGVGIRGIEIGGINNPTGCEPNGYGDYTGLVADLAPDSTNQLIMDADYGNQYVRVWIDFNDDQTFTLDEVVVDNYLFAAGQGPGTYSESMDLVVPAGAALGQHRMRVRASANVVVPDNACEETMFGETEDYTANIDLLGINDLAINDSSLIITSQENNQFEIALKSEYDGVVYMGVYNLLGQQLGVKMIRKDDANTYTMKLNMASAASGVYLIRVGGTDSRTFKTGRIIVK